MQKKDYNNIISYREKTKSRCRDKVFESIYKVRKSDEKCFEDLCYFEQQYSNLKVKDYIIKMRNVAISYSIDDSLTKEERKIYVDGMEFVYDCIRKINSVNKNIVLNNDIKLEFINAELENELSNGKLVLTEQEKEVFKLGILASSAINFNIIDTNDIISKHIVKK